MGDSLDRAADELLPRQTAKRVTNSAVTAISVVVTNVGSEPSSGSLTVRDTLPPGVFVASPESCVAVVGGSMLTCREGNLPRARVTRLLSSCGWVPGAASSAVNFAEVEGGGAPRR